jgi:two-component system, LytTR family, response regulator
VTTGHPPARTLIVDDEPLARRRLRTLLADEPDIEIVGEAANGNAAVTAVAEKRPDLLLLDIQMPGKDGFQVLQEIAGPHQPVVVFITAHDEHAIRAFDVEALDYVLKPVVEGRLRAAVQRAVKRLREQHRGDLSAAMARLLEQVRPSVAASRIPIRRDGRVTFVSAAEIEWVEAERDLVKLHTARASHVLRMTMAEVEARLGSRRFARVHRSALVNVECIHEIQPLFKGGYILVLRSGARVRSGRLYRSIVRSLI